MLEKLWNFEIYCRNFLKLTLDIFDLEKSKNLLEKTDNILDKSRKISFKKSWKLLGLKSNICNQTFKNFDIDLRNLLEKKNSFELQVLLKKKNPQSKQMIQTPKSLLLRSDVWLNVSWVGTRL